jgi:acetyltransferase-like isoleucine patch superfamily enzyme
MFRIKTAIRYLSTHICYARYRWIKTIWGGQDAVQILRSADKRTLLHILSHEGAHIGHNCDFETGVTFHNCVDFSNLYIGEDVHIGKNCFFDLKAKIEIYDRVTISMQSTFLSHTDVGKSRLAHSYNKSSQPISIGPDCYIGACATLLPGVSLGAGCIVAAGCVVTSSFSDCSFIAGVPARLRKTLHIS